MLINFIVSEIEAPPLEYDGKVDVEKFWEFVSLEVVSCSLVPSKYSQYVNLFGLTPAYFLYSLSNDVHGYHFLIIDGTHLWLIHHMIFGPLGLVATRAFDLVLNTESCKIQRAEDSSELNITEDRLGDELLNFKVFFRLYWYILKLRVLHIY